MVSIKQQIRDLLDALPDDVTYEDVQYHLYVRQKIERSLRDIAEGRTSSADEVRERMRRWTETSGAQKSRKET